MAEQQSNENDTILINIMYTGDYTNKNIGHEIINLYKTDNDENYIYISPYGKIPDTYENNIKKVLLARPAKAGCMEIVAIAEELEWLLEHEVEKKKEDLKKQRKYSQYVNKKNEEALKRYYIGQILTKSDSNNEKSLKELNKEELRKKYISDCMDGIDKDKKEFLFKEICRDKGIDEEIIKIDDEGEFKKALKLEYYYKQLLSNGYKEISENFIFRNSNEPYTKSEIRNIQYRFILKQITDENYIKIDTTNRNENRDNLKNKREGHLNDSDKNKVIEDKDIFEFEKAWTFCKKINVKDVDEKIKLGSGRNKTSITLKDLMELKSGLNSEKINIKKYLECFENTEVPNRWKKDIFLHEEHSKCIHNEETPIKYGNAYLDEIFTNNKYNDTTVHFTFSSGSVKIKKKDDNKYDKSYPLCIEYEIDSSKGENEDDSDVEIGKNAKIIAIDKKSNIYKVTGKKLRNQSCKVYIKKSENEEFYEKLIDIIGKQEKIYSKDCPKMDTKEIQLDPCFLDITKNQYDELSYSNMFAYFFKEYPELFEEFAKEKLSQKDTTLENFEKGEFFEIAREENDIDILVKTKNDIFVIENKIKSSINGEKNIDTEKYTNQLIKYYNYVESKYPGKKRHYFIFKPNYNNIKAELDAKVKNANKDIKDIINNKYHNIDYSDIHEFYEKKPDKWLEEKFQAKIKKDERDRITEDKKNICDYIKNNDKMLMEYVYFKDFVKALKRHISSTDNTNELLMEYKFRQAIKDAIKRKENEK